MKHIKYFLVLFVSFFIFSSKYDAHIELELKNESNKVKEGDIVEVVSSLCTTKQYIPTTGDFSIKWDNNKLELIEDYDSIETIRENYFYLTPASLSFFNKSILNNTGIANIVYEYSGNLNALRSDTCFNIMSLKFKVKQSDVSTIAYVYTDENQEYALGCYDTTYKEYDQNCYKVYDTKVPINILGNDTEGSLSSLIVMDAILGKVLEPFPNFSSDVKNYTYEVEHDVSAIRINSICASENCTIKGNGKKSLVVGDNVFKVITKVNNKSTTYTITITRKGSEDSTLKSIKLLDEKDNRINYVFKGNTSNYLTVSNSITKINFDAECQTKNCTIKEIDNKELKIGVNKIKLLVIAEDKENTTTYTFYVTRLKEDIALLNSLSIEGYELNEPFNPNTYEYTVKIKRNVKELNFNYEKSNENYIVIIDGNTNLGKENKEITLTIKGTDSNNVNIYKINTIMDTRGYIVFLYVTIPLLIILFCLVVYLIVLKNKVNEE